MTTSNLPSCVEDFEEQRAVYEGTIYGSFVFLLLLVGLPIRCCLPASIRAMWRNRLQPTSLRLSDQQTAAAFLKFVLVVAPVPMFCIPYAYIVLFPHCTCPAATTTCDVCTLQLDTISLGSCHKVATAFGVVSLLFAVVVWKSAQRKLRALRGTTVSYTEVDDTVGP